MSGDNHAKYQADLLAVAQDQCPVCGGELDTGWECNDCGKDCQPLLVMVRDEMSKVLARGRADG